MRAGSPDDRFMVDVSAVPIISGRDTLYYLLFPASQALDDSVRLQLVATENPNLSTSDGMRVGLTLAEAVAVAGPVTLAYNVNDESREYARFDTQPPSLRFRVRSATESGGFAGEYSTTAEYNSTTRYDPRARISMILVDLMEPPREPQAK